MRTTSLFAVSAAALLGLLGLTSLGDAPAGFWAPEGFVAQADTVIGRGYLELRCADQDTLVAAFPPESPAEEFFNASYLRADVRSFNASPEAARSPFLIEGCRILGVDPFFHRIDLPYNRLPRWRGDVLFTFDGETATLEGGTSQELQIRHPVDRSDAAAGATWVSPDRADARVFTSLLHLTRGAGSPEVLADAFFVGGSPVFTDRRDVGSGEVLRVNGFRTPPGRMLRLESGDWLQVSGGGAGGPHTYLAETGDRARTASFVRVRNDKVERLFPARRLRPWLEPFTRAMDLALHSIPGAEATTVVEADVRLTLDRELTDALDGRLGEWCRERSHPTRPRATSLLVMDAFNGAVRAMPSCPGEEELGPFEPLSTRTRERFLRNQNLSPHPVGSAAKPFWAAAMATTYPNFLDLEIPAHLAGAADTVLGCPLPASYNDNHAGVGWTGLEEFIQRSCNRYLIESASAALAIGSQETGLECRGSMEAGAFVRCLPDATEAGQAATRAGGDASAAGEDEVGRSRLRFCDAVINTVLSPGLEVVGESCGDLQLVDAKFAAGPTLSELANVAVYRDPSPRFAAADGQPSAIPELGEQYRLGRYRFDAWRTVLGELEAAGDTAHLVQTALRFASVSPQATNLALNTVEELRTDWVNLLLGGENSRWSNFELAEAVGRLVTGRSVRGTLADSVGGASLAPVRAEASALLPARALHSGARRRVLHAMELVARPGGTAGRLAPAIARVGDRLRAIDARRPYELFAFAKTGTPAVEKFVSSAQQQLVSRLYGRGDLSWDGRRFALRGGLEDEIRATLGGGTLRWLREDVLAPIEANPAAFTAGGDGRLPAHPLYLRANGTLGVRELADLRVDRQGGVLILSLLAVPADQGRARAAVRSDWVSACSLDPGLRRAILEVPPADLLDPERSVALSVAIYLDDLAPGEGSGFAIDLADRVMDDIGVYLEREVRRKLEEAG